MTDVNRKEVEDRIAAVAGAQHGVITAVQLGQAGVSPAGISRRARRGNLRRLHRGVYLVGPILLSWTREMAASLAAGGRALVSHTSAIPLWGLGGESARAPAAVVGLDWQALAPIHVSVTHGNPRRQDGLRFHRVAGIPASQQATRFGIPVTSPARTILDVSSILGSGDLGRVVARAEREGLVRLPALMSLIERHRGRPGTPALREVLAIPGGPAVTRSEAEDRFLALTVEGRLPRPRVNVRMGPYEIDFLWPDEKVAVEVDGFRYHSTRPRFEGDHRKDVWLRARGIDVIRLTWRQITEEATATAIQVGQALVLAAERKKRR